MANGHQTPPSPAFGLGSNDDELERAQARAARAAAIRRKAAAAAAASASSPAGDPCLSKEQIIELFQNCIRLASENKINQMNTWELKLIDHLSEIIKVKCENDEESQETNFQKASFTLEAGVKIYSARVDSMHAEAYKVLSRMNWASAEDEQETTRDDENVNNEQGGVQPKKELDRKITPLSTLESSFEALNVKKFDVAFTVDPLYHQTSAQFDEGGAKGLLLNNLGVYGECQVLFDSYEVPRKCRSRSLHSNPSEVIDLSFLKESIEDMVVSMRAENEICPTFKEILSQLGENNNRSSQDYNVSQNSDLKTNSLDDEKVERDISSGIYDTWTIDHDDDISIDQRSFGDPAFQSHHEDNNSRTSYEADEYDRFDKVSTFLFHGLGFSSKENAWAGPGHWKYSRPKGSEEASPTKSRPTTKRSKKENHTEVDLDFTASLDKEFLDIFAVPKNLKSLLLPANRVLISNRLPEDCHSQPEDFVKLFLLPNVLFLEKGRRHHTDNSWEQSNHFDEAFPPCDTESVLSGQDSDGCIHSNVEDLDTLVSQPRQVSKIQVRYNATSKQVDVHVLKETLWGHIQESVNIPTMDMRDTVSFKDILAAFPVNRQAAVPGDISPHLCFICLLHLANEHRLSIHDFPSLDDLSIHLPSR